MILWGGEWEEYSYFVSRRGVRREGGGGDCQGQPGIHPFGDGQVNYGEYLSIPFVFMLCLLLCCAHHMFQIKSHNFNVCFRIISILSGRINIHPSRRNQLPTA